MLVYSFSLPSPRVIRQNFAQLAHVVMSERASSQNIPLEPDVVIKNPVSEAVRVDDEDHVEFDLDELKEQLGIETILEKLNVLAEKFSGKGLSTLVQGLKIQSPHQKLPRALLTLRLQLFCQKLLRQMRFWRKSSSFPRSLRRPKVLGQM